ncbi:hypothetical protein COCON_G00102560 [Conger conger]|uniref:Borealin N-terminal domain-containing protein n=1 Tax=Conger conger TaxID=82655 RepID=A0A9Q1DHU1_CONCO|nr:hypothetical protein COCON_G00102560 [Conger conger]
MEPRKLKKVYQRSESELDGQLSKEQRDQKKKQLFLQQFEKEAQERIREMELKAEQLLATVERAFRVELMKLPPQLQGTLLKDLMKENDEEAGEVTIAMKAQSPEIHRPLTRKSSKKAQARANPPRRKRMLSVQNQTPSLAASTGMSKSRSTCVLHVSSSSKVRGSSTSVIKRTRSRASKADDLVASSNGQKRSTNSRGLSFNPFVTASATILTSCGEALCLSDDVKDDIDVDMLDDTAVHQMQKLMQLMDYLCNKAKVNNGQ